MASSSTSRGGPWYGEPSPIQGLRINLEEIPLILCNEVGVSFLVQKFNKVKKSNLRFALAGSLKTVKATVHICSTTTVTSTISFDISEEMFIIKFHVESEMQGQQWTKLEQHGPGQEEEEEGKVGYVEVHHHSIPI